MRRLLAILAVSSIAAPALAGSTLDVEVAAYHRGPDPVDVEVSVEGVLVAAQVVPSPGRATFPDLEAGNWIVTASATGFDVASSTVALASDRTLSLSLFPAADVTLSGTVSAAVGGPAVGATLAVSGERIAAPRFATASGDGTFEVGGLPAGFYDVEVTSSEGGLIVRTDVDVLGDTVLAFVVPDTDEDPEIRRFRHPFCSASPGAGPAPLLFGLGLLLVRRRR